MSRLGVRPLGDGRAPIPEPNATTTVTPRESPLQKEQMNREIGVPPTVKICPRTSTDGRFMEPQPARDLGTPAALRRRSTKRRCGGDTAAESSRGGAWAWTRNAATGSQSRLGWMRPPGDAGGDESLATRISRDVGGGRCLAAQNPSRDC
jgi:hypothetical protein